MNPNDSTLVKLSQSFPLERLISPKSTFGFRVLEQLIKFSKVLLKEMGDGWVIHRHIQTLEVEEHKVLLSIWFRSAV